MGTDAQRKCRGRLCIQTQVRLIARLAVWVEQGVPVNPQERRRWRGAEQHETLRKALVQLAALGWRQTHFGRMLQVVAMMDGVSQRRGRAAIVAAQGDVGRDAQAQGRPTVQAPHRQGHGIALGGAAHFECTARMAINPPTSLGSDFKS